MSMPKEITAWQMVSPERPLAKNTLPVPELGPQDVLVEVAGCGLCHTDLSFLYGGVKTKKAPPLTLGHEFSGTVVAAGDGMKQRIGETVVVPAVLPCGECELCKAGRGNACRKQIMPGNDLDGGFASHAVVPGRFVCDVEPRGMELWELGIVADAVTTPYQAMERASVGKGDTVVIIGAGGIGTYGVQIAAARGASVVALDIDEDRLERIGQFGANKTINCKDLDARGVRDAVRGVVKEMGRSPFAWKVFEMSGTASGQSAAYELLTFAGTVGFIGFTMEKVPVRLGNLMAFDATLFGNWGCLPQYYGPAIELVLGGQVQIRPFCKRFALDEINDVVAKTRAHQLKERPVLIP